uniref:Rho-GAP domain-containing protein n=1 Tax=Haemonchus contortus TaxID=6289 RepID=A0A7I5EDE8_HAECO
MNEFEVCTVTPSTNRPLPTESSSGSAGSVHRLGYVHSVDVELELLVREGGRNGITKLKLKQVPKFLVNAFNFIIKNGLALEGLFRREGNASRLNQNNFAVYLGAAPLPPSFTVHDVCSMVKRFFRDLKEPLLPNPALRKSLLELVKRNEVVPVTRHDFCSLFETRYDVIKKTWDRSLPDAHIGTLGYLMRQLQGISRHSDKNQMDSANLATVFAPTLFRQQKIRRKDRRGSQDDLLTTLRSDTKLQIAAVQLLIERANWIGLHPNFYVTSVHHHRSCSAAPSPRQPFMPSIANLKAPLPCAERKHFAKGDVVAAPHLSDREAAIKAGDIGKLKPSAKRRSSSAFRGIINGIGDRLLKRSPSRERGKANRRQSSPAIVVTATQQHRSRLPRRPSPEYTLEFASPPHSNSSEQVNTNIAPVRDSARSSSSRASRSGQPVVITSARPSAHVLGHQNMTSKLNGSQSIGRSSHRTAEAAIYRRDSGRKRGETPPRRANKVLKDNPVSMLGEEHFNPTYREQHERSRRRHTTPVKTSTALRRNQPNTRHSGLQQPKRRATVVNAHEQEKENHHRTGSVSASNSCEDIEATMAEDSLTLTDSSADILTQKGHESRLRRAKRQHRRELSSVLQDSLFDSSSCPEPIDKKDDEKSFVRKVSVGCSPIIFPRSPVDSKENHGSAFVGETIVVTPAALPSDSYESSSMDLPTDLCISPPPMEPRSTARPLITTHSPSKEAAVVLKQSPSRRVLPQEPSVSMHPGGDPNEDVQQVVFRVPSLPNPFANPLSMGELSTDRVGSVNTDMRRKAPVRPKSPRNLHSMFPLRVLKSVSLDDDRQDRFVTRVPSNPSAEPALEPSSPLASPVEPFEASSELKAALINARCDEDMEATIGRHFRVRPSVAFIQKQGIVRDRVNLFRQLGNTISVPLEPVSGRRFRPRILSLPRRTISLDTHPPGYGSFPRNLPQATAKVLGQNEIHPKVLLKSRRSISSIK